MKKVLFGILALAMIAGMVACGEKPNDSSNPQQNMTSGSIENSNSSTANEVENSNPTTSLPEKSSVSNVVSSAKNGTLTLSKSNVAIVVNGTSVPMPYKLKELEAAGVPADESRSEIELGAGDLFSANLFIDDNEDYVIIPAYQNKGDSAIKITEAEAEEITMTTYADDPVDQGVSILGISFGMEKSKVKELLGEPMSDDGSYLEWHIELPDMAYEGTLSMYVTGDADDAGVSQINLTVFPK